MRNARNVALDQKNWPPCETVRFRAEKIVDSWQCARLSSGLDMFVRHTRCNFPDGPRSKHRSLHLSLASYHLDFARFYMILMDFARSLIKFPSNFLEKPTQLRREATDKFLLWTPHIYPFEVDFVWKSKLGDSSIKIYFHRFWKIRFRWRFLAQL